ncbi:unnamed protein product, partial [marine sediment metagenome]
MVVIESYTLAVIMLVITMLCWGSWANTQKLASKEWSFQLFYWDYAIGVFLLSLVLAFTMGSIGTEGRSFLPDLAQASTNSLGLALLGGVIFNLSNILLVGAIDIAGMAVAFPVGVGLALVIGVITNYIATPVGNAMFLFVGVGLVTVAIILDALAYKRLPSQSEATTKGIVLSIAARFASQTRLRTWCIQRSVRFAYVGSGPCSSMARRYMYSISVSSSENAPF